MVTNVFAGIVAVVVSFNAVHQVQAVERPVSLPVSRLETGTVMKVIAASRSAVVETVVNPLNRIDVNPGVVGVRVRV